MTIYLGHTLPHASVRFVVTGGQPGCVCTRGRSPLSLSHAVIGRPAGLTASRRHSPRQAEFARPHSRAVQRLTFAEFRVRPLSSLGLAFADAGLRTWARHVCDCSSASWPLSFGSATAVGGALAQNYGSDLLPLRLLFAHMLAALFLAPPAFRKVFTGFAMARCPSRNECSVCPAFRRLSLG